MRGSHGSASAPVMPHCPPRAALTVAEAAYASAHFGKSLLWHGSQLLFAYFLTEACGLPILAMGLVLTCALLLNACCDLAVGRLLSRFAPAYRSVALAQLAGAVLTALAVTLFAQAGQVAAEDRMTAVLIGLGCFALAYSLLDVPQNAILGLAPLGPDRRRRASATRLVMAGCAEVVVVMGFAVLMRGLPADAVGDGFLWLSAGTGVVAIFGAAVLAFSARNSVEPPAAPEHTPQNASAMTSLVGMGSIVLLMGIYMIGSKITGKLEPYIADAWFATVLDGAAFMAAIAIGGMVGQPLWLARARRHQSRADLSEPAVVLAVGGFLFSVSGSGPLGAAASGLLLGVGQGGISLILWTRLAELISRTPARATALTGLFTFVSKSVAAVATLIMSQILLQDNAQATSPHQMQLGSLVMTWLPAFTAMVLIASERLMKSASPLRAAPTAETP